MRALIKRLVLSQPGWLAGWVVMFVKLLFVLPCQSIASPDAIKAGTAARANKTYLDAKSRFRTETNSPEAAWHFARACFDFSDCATNNADKAKIADEGVKASRLFLGRRPDLVQVHYYLGMNLGQIADTKRNLAALRLVDEMEHEFKAARDLDERFDFAGPDRNLGLLYWQAPSFISIGSRSHAREHLRRAVELAPNYPENRLNLIEAYLKWGARTDAMTELRALEDSWSKALKEFAGEQWNASWVDWERRLQAAEQKLGMTSKTDGAPQN